jgi:hypothetical protein
MNSVSDLKVLDRAYLKIDIEFIELDECFGPEIVQLSENGTYQNFMLLVLQETVCSLTGFHQLGGVRLIVTLKLPQ